MSSCALDGLRAVCMEHTAECGCVMCDAITAITEAEAERDRLRAAICGSFELRYDSVCIRFDQSRSTQDTISRVLKEQETCNAD